MFRRRAMHFSWSEVAERMLDAFQRADQAREPRSEVHGRWLVAAAAPIPEFSSFAGWYRENIEVVQSGAFERLKALPAESPRFIQRQVRKSPWPEVYTFTMQVRPNAFHSLAMSICGETEEERASVKFDLCTGHATRGFVSDGWMLLDARISRVGGDFLCQAVVRGDWSPVLRCGLVMYRGHHYTNSKRKRQGLLVSHLSLSRGLPLAARVVRFSRLRSVLGRFLSGRA
jgi:hypothetical protein